jgi:hypothetical protein
MKQRHTAKFISTCLRDEDGFFGGFASVTVRVREKGRLSKEVVVSQSHALGNAQVQFGETLDLICRIACKWL